MALVSCTYDQFYEGFCVYAGSTAGAEDAKSFDADYFRKNPDPSSVEFREGVCEVRPGFLSCFPTLAQIVIPDSMEKIGLTEDEKTFLKMKGAVIRGTFGSYAEEFAREQRLRFMHSDFEIARAGEYETREGVDIITLCFTPKGKPYVHQDNCCPGSSAGSVGGGSIDFDLPKLFWKTMTPETLAGKCWGTCRDEIVKCEELKRFFEGAQARKGYMT